MKTLFLMSLVVLAAQATFASEVKKEFLGSVTVSKGPLTTLLNGSPKVYPDGTYNVVLTATYENPNGETDPKSFEFNTRSVLTFADSGATLDIKGFSLYDNRYMTGLRYNRPFDGVPQLASRNATFDSTQKVACELPIGSPACREVAKGSNTPAPTCRAGEVSRGAMFPEWISDNSPAGAYWSISCCDEEALKGSQELQIWTRSTANIFEGVLGMRDALVELDISKTSAPEKYIDYNRSSHCHK